MANKLPENLKCVRQDLSDWVWHFTRRDRNPKQTLETILKSKQLLGGTNYCGVPAVCFTEMPLIDSVRQSETLDKYSFGRMSNYGIGFKKEWIFSRGGRPVIYGTWTERDKLPPDLLWRHCDFDLSRGVDYTWQREWRVPVDVLTFDTSDDPLVVLPTWQEAMELLWGL